jgi:hypothetical protein
MGHVIRATQNAIVKQILYKEGDSGREDAIGSV